MAKKNELMNETLQHELVITRVFNAPRQQVFNAWTESDHLKKWWGPKGYSIRVKKFDLRPGGIFHYKMESKEGKVMWGRFNYKEIITPERIVFINSFSDESGNITKAPFGIEFPLEILYTVTFTEQPGKTTLILRGTPVNATEEEMDVFESMFGSMQIGFSGTFDQLDDFLKESDTSDRELVITRVLNAPRELVYEAWTEPEHLINWWGPTGFTNSFHEFNMRPGGVWRFTMHGPDGVDYPNKVIFNEVIPQQRLAFILSDDNGKESDAFDVTVTFEKANGKTKLTMRMLFKTAAERDRVVNEYGAMEGNRQTLDKLEALLAKMQPLVITRLYNAPRHIVFGAWTDEKQLAKWWGPENYTNPVCELDLQPGGKIYIEMTALDGTVYPMEGKFKEIDQPNRLVFTSSAIKDEHGDAQLEILNTITFTEVNGKTELTLIAEILKATPAAQTSVNGMQQGWSESLDKLTVLLVKG
jgi:uncharacterized protein YndB with AHSA1/START domain